MMCTVKSVENNNIHTMKLDGDNNNGRSVLKKGLLWQHKDKFLSRWKHRYFILTNDYLSCFKKSSNKHSDMGAFIFKLNLVDMEGLEWLNCTRNNKDKDVIILKLSKRQGANILLAGDDLMDWFIILQKTIAYSKERRQVLRSSTSSLPRTPILLTSRLSERKVAISPHLYALQHTMSDSKIGVKSKLSIYNDQDDNIHINEYEAADRDPKVNLKSVSDHQRTPHLNKRNRISVLSTFNDDMDFKGKMNGADLEPDLGIDVNTPSPGSTPVQMNDRRRPDSRRVQDDSLGKINRKLVKSYSHGCNQYKQDHYLCTSSPAVNRSRQSADLVPTSSAKKWGRESPVLSQGSVYAKHVLSSPIAGSRRSHKYSSFIESPSKNKKNKAAGAKNVQDEFAFIQSPLSNSKRRACTLPDNRHLSRSTCSEPGIGKSERFSMFLDDKLAAPGETNHPRQVSYGLLRFIDSATPSPEL